MNKKLAKDTVGLVHLNQFQKIREDIESEDTKDSGKRIEREMRKRKMQQAASKLSFEVDELVDEEDAQEDSVKKSRLGADPSVKSYFEASDYLAATSAALESSKERLELEKKQRDEKKKSSLVRLTLSFYDGADHRFCVDFKRATGFDVPQKVSKEYGPLKGVLLDDLMIVKENLILPTELSVFDLEEMGALKDGGRGPITPVSFSFNLQAKDQKNAANSGDPTSTAPLLNPDEMIETDASRNAKFVVKSGLNGTST